VTPTEARDFNFKDNNRQTADTVWAEMARNGNTKRINEPREEADRVRFDVTADDVNLLDPISDFPERQTNETNTVLEHPCRVCGVKEGQYQPDSCKCRYSYCRKCAMKLGTGGKCISCGKFYGSVRLSR
jgi:hypothetical protein